MKPQPRRANGIPGAPRVRAGSAHGPHADFGGSPKSSSLRSSPAALLLCVILLAPLAGWTGESRAHLTTTDPAIPTVGMEGRLEATLPGTLLEARPVDEKSLIVLRVADTRPHGTLTWYDLRYFGLEPGKYDLRDYLRRQDGSPLGDLPQLRVEIAGLLPIIHTGELIEPPRGVLGLFGGYLPTLAAAAGLWVLGALVLWLTGRRRKTAVVVPAAQPAPTLAERMRPLVAAAAAGQISADGKAQLERLLLSHWRERLQFGEMNQAEAIAALRRHPEAGALLAALEDWLHRPPGVARVDVGALLAPYRDAGAPPPPDSRTTAL